MLDKYIENVEQVLGCLLVNPTLQKQPEYNFSVENFVRGEHKILYVCIYNMHKLGITSTISVEDFVSYIQTFNETYFTMYKEYDSDFNYFRSLLANANLDNFDYHYTRMRKFLLLDELCSGGWDISRVYDVTNTNKSLNSDFENRTIDELLESLFKFSNDLKKKWCTTLNQESKMTVSSDSIDELIDLFKSGQTYGIKLLNPIMNVAFGGARTTKVLLDAGQAGSGKSRFSIANACNMAMPFKYNPKSKKWESNGLHEPVLCINTELMQDEIQAMMLAHIAHVDESSLRYDYEGLSNEEKNRIGIAKELLKRYPIQMCYLPNYDLNDLEVLLEEYVLKYGVKYIFFDYIHLTGKIISQLKGIREDIIILQIMTAIKNLCTKFDCFCWVGSQLNRNSTTGESKDSFAQLRSSFSIGDKIDGCTVASKPTQKEIEDLLESIGGFGNKRPNLYRTIIKNRGGKLNGIRIWVKFNHGKLHEEVIAVTDLDGVPISVDLIEQEEGQINNCDSILDYLNKQTIK